MTLRLLALLALPVLLTACDSSDDSANAPLLSVSARTAAGAPAAGLDVFVTYGGLLPSAAADDGATLSRGGGFQVSPPAPNPARGASSYGYFIPAAGPVRVRLLDVAGTERAVLRDDVVEAGSYRDVIDLDGYASGVYSIEVTYGGETLTRDVLKTDAAIDGLAGLALFLGRTGADGRLTTSDSTRFPALYTGPRSYLVTDEQGNALSEFQIDRTVGVIVQNEAGETDGTQVRLDGRGTEATLTLTP